MTTVRTRTILPAITITTLALLLTGCSGGGGTTTATAPTGHATTATSAPATPDPTRTPTATAAAGGAGTAPAATGTSGSGTASVPKSSSGSSSAQGSSAGGRCATSQLAGSVADGGGSSAGAVRVAIILRNKGAQQCTLQGWPGISFVGRGNGTQIGNPAVLDRATPHQTLTLRPGGEVQAVVTVEQAGDWNSATCEPRVSDGFRVIPPGSTQSLFVGASGSIFEACASTSLHQLTTSALASF